MADGVDQEARDLAREAVALLREHAAVCSEDKRNRNATIEEIKDLLRNSQRAFETARADADARHELAIKAVRTDLQAAMDRRAEAQAAVNDQLYNRFWGAAVAYGGTMTLLAGFLVGKLLHWI